MNRFDFDSFCKDNINENDDLILTKSNGRFKIISESVLITTTSTTEPTIFSSVCPHGMNPSTCQICNQSSPNNNSGGKGYGNGVSDGPVTTTTYYYALDGQQFTSMKQRDAYNSSIADSHNSKTTMTTAKTTGAEDITTANNETIQNIFSRSTTTVDGYNNIGDSENIRMDTMADIGTGNLLLYKNLESTLTPQSELQKINIGSEYKKMGFIGENYSDIDKWKKFNEYVRIQTQIDELKTINNDIIKKEADEEYSKLEKEYWKDKENKVSIDYQKFDSEMKERTGGKDIKKIQADYKRRTSQDITYQELYLLHTDPEYTNYRCKDNNINDILRDVLNEKKPEEMIDAEEYKWRKMSYLESLYHNPKDNYKFVSPDGYREVIYDKKTGGQEEIFKTKYRGTYNFFPGSINAYGHYIADMLPWEWSEYNK